MLKESNIDLGVSFVLSDGVRFGIALVHTLDLSSAVMSISTMAGKYKRIALPIVT